MTASTRLRLVSQLQLPDVWRSQELAAQERVLPSGHAVLDAQLPGGGWPLGGAVELLQQGAGQHMWQLLLPALVQALRQQPGPVVLVNAPFEPFGPSLQAQGLPLARLLRVQADRPQAALWATEQALRCADLAAVLAWLPKAKSPELHRLHLAAGRQERLFFVLRPLQAQQQATPARLRIALEGTDEIRLRILKRRGPPLLQPLRLPAHPPRLAALLQARKRKGAAVPEPLLPERSHGLDRTETLA